jgi:hypothetical protein
MKVKSVNAMNTLLEAELISERHFLGLVNLQYSNKILSIKNTVHVNTIER